MIINRRFPKNFVSLQGEVDIFERLWMVSRT